MSSDFAYSPYDELDDSGPSPPILDWLPPLVLMADYDQQFHKYIAAVYEFFRRDFFESPFYLDRKRVVCRRDPIYDGKEAGFWHCTSEGRNESERNPDLRRCERISWIKAIIENVGHPLIDDWTISKHDRASDVRRYLWFNEEYLIVLGARKNVWQLITCFTTPQEHYRRKLRSERDSVKS